jgi:hypothetical protein
VVRVDDAGLMAAIDEYWNQVALLRQIGLAAIAAAGARMALDRVQALARQGRRAQCPRVIGRRLVAIAILALSLLVPGSALALPEEEVGEASALEQAREESGLRSRPRDEVDPPRAAS